MMDIIWVYKFNRTDELEYSIKSANNLEHNRKIVVGDKPLFESDVEHAKPAIVRWAMTSTHHDVISKLNYACTLDISDDFIFFNDDFFVMSPTTVPVAHRETLDEHIANRKVNDSYTKTLKKTNDYLKSLGIKNPLSYELHIPIVYNKHKLKDMYDTIIPMITHAGPMLTRSLYGNIYKIGGVQLSDCKNPSVYKDKVFLSSNDKTFNSELGEYIRSVL